MKKKKTILYLTMLTILFTAFSVQASATVRLSKTKLTMLIGQSKTLKVLGTGKSAVWSTSKKTVAIVKKGKITAKSFGKSIITAKVGSKKLKCTVTVKKPVLSASSITLKTGNSKTLTLKQISSGQKIAWSSDKPSVASVNKKGKVTAKKAGTAVISAKAAGKTYKCKVKVTGSVQVTYITKSYKYDGKTLFTIKVPKGWIMEVTGVTSSATNPAITIHHPTDKNLSVNYVMASTMVKSKAGHDTWVSYSPASAFAGTPYLIPASGYASDGMDTAGAFLGLCKFDSSVTSPKIGKKLGSLRYFGDFLYYTYKINGKGYKGVFNADVQNGNTYYYGGVDVGAAAVNNAGFLQAPSASFDKWKDVLCTVMGSLTLKQAFLDKATSEGARAVMSLSDMNAQFKTCAQIVKKNLK